MNYHNRQGAMQGLAFASQLAPAIIGVVSFMILVRVTNPDLLGQYLILSAAVVLFEMIKSGGLQSALVMRLSGSTPLHQKQTIGSAYWLGGIISGLLSLFLGIAFLSNLFKYQPGIHLFCGWYACLGIITLPLHIAEAQAVADQKLSFLLTLRIAQSLSSLLIATFAFFIGGSLLVFATVHLTYTALLMLIVVFSGKTNPLYIRFKVMNEVKKLFNLIKYTLATLATTNLLKSADTFLIGSFLGTRAVAMYAVPLKLTELFEIPLRSLSTTAFPQLAKSNNNSHTNTFKQLYIQYLSWAYLLYIPGIIIAFFLAPFLITTIGGDTYLSTVTVFRIFLLYGILLPADRLSGIGLDALQKPQKNLLKVVCMAVINIIGDVLALQLTGQLEWVAFASVLNVLTGIIVGNYFIKSTGIFNSTPIYASSLVYSKSFIKDQVKKLRLKTS